LTSELISGLKTTVNAILPHEIENKKKLPATFNFENIKSLFETKWKTAFGRPLPLIQPQKIDMLLNNRIDLNELFDFDHPSTAFNFKTELELVFKCELSPDNSEDELIQRCHSYVINSPLEWWNESNYYRLQINRNKAQKTMNASSSISSKQASQTMEYNVIEKKTAKIANLRPDLTLKDSFCRILFKGKSIPFKYHFISEFSL
jgi:hypothetical protein